MNLKPKVEIHIIEIRSENPVISYFNVYYYEYTEKVDNDNWDRINCLITNKSVNKRYLGTYFNGYNSLAYSIIRALYIGADD